MCEELVQTLTETLNAELNGVGPEDVLEQMKLDELQHALSKQVMVV